MFLRPKNHWKNNAPQKSRFEASCCVTPKIPKMSWNQDLNGPVRLVVQKTLFWGSYQFWRFTRGDFLQSRKTRQNQIQTEIEMTHSENFLLKYFPSLHSVKKIRNQIVWRNMILKYENTSADVSACRKKATHLVRSMRRISCHIAFYRRDIYFLSFLSEEGARNSKKVNLSFYAPSYDRKQLCDPLLSQKSPICLPGERFGFTCCPAY